MCWYVYAGSPNVTRHLLNVFTTVTVVPLRKYKLNHYLCQNNERHSCQRVQNAVSEMSAFHFDIQVYRQK